MQRERIFESRLFKAFSIAVWILCCAYVVMSIHRTGALQRVSQSLAAYPSAFALVIALYVLAGLGIASAFAFLVWGLSTGQGLRSDIIGVHALTQIGKYLPTNTFHLIGRHAVLRRSGLSDAALLRASFSEVAFLLVVAAGLAVLGAHDELATHLDLDPRTLAIIGAVLTALIFIVATSMRGRLKALSSPFLTGRVAVAAMAAVAVYCLFFTLSGSILRVLLTEAIRVPAPPDIGRLTSYAAISWSIGFVSPGAAAGIGVRETILILLLDGVIAPAPATSVAVAYRLVTTAGDLITCGLGGMWWWARR